MSIESITARIKEEAKAYADAVKKSAQTEVDSLLAETRIEADKIVEEAKARADKDSKLLVERRESVAGLEARKMQLNAKQDVIQESFEKALDKLLNLGEKDYFKFLTTQLSTFAEQGGEIRLNASDLKKYGDKLEKEVGGKFKVSKSPVAVKGGFLLKQGDIFINASIEKLLDDQKEKLTGEIAKALFK